MYLRAPATSPEPTHTQIGPQTKTEHVCSAPIHFLSLICPQPPHAKCLLTRLAASLHVGFLGGARALLSFSL